MAADDETIAIAILEDDPETLEYLVGIFSRAHGFSVAFACSTLAEANKALETRSADICLVDIRLPDGSGLEFIAPFKRKTGGKALILTVLGDRSSVLLAFEFGASGYLLKDTQPDQVITDIRALWRGGSPISPQIATHLLELLNDRRASSVSEPTVNLLSGREQEVLAMFSRGLSYKDAAVALGISSHTIADHVKSIYAKMDVHSRNQAVFEAVRQGWLSL